MTMACPPIRSMLKAILDGLREPDDLEGVIDTLAAGERHNGLDGIARSRVYGVGGPE